MATKRDQLQAYQFLVQRVVSALVIRESDPEQPPFRRPTAAAIGSVALAVLVLAGFGVFGLIAPGGKNAWRDGESIIVEKETGTRFVYLDGRLHPVTNYVSALLALNKHAPLMNVSRNSLAGVTRGPRIGIEDAPDSLPGPNGVLISGWSICSAPGKDETGAMVEESVLMVGRQPVNARQVDADALLVAVERTGDQYLLWNGYRHRIDASDTVTLGLALRSEPRATVAAELLDALPVGDALKPIRLTDLGKPSRAVATQPGLRIGQLMVLSASGGNPQYYLADRDQLRPLSPLQYDIQLAFAPTEKAYGGRQPVGVPLGLIEAGRANLAAPAPTGPGQLPSTRPTFVDPGDAGTALCATFDPGQAVPRLAVEVVMPPKDERTVTPASTTRGTRLADRVVVPPGQVALVETMPSTGTPAPAVGLVSDLGVYYPLAGADLLDALGYAGVAPVRMPAGLVARIPAGDGLDAEAARHPIPNATSR
jgi:type VII secretion protein EccB